MPNDRDRRSADPSRALPTDRPALPGAPEARVEVGALHEVEADAVVVGIFEGEREPSGALAAIDRALGGQVAELIELGDLAGARDQVRVLYPRGGAAARRVVVAGLGPREGFGPEAARRAAAAAAAAAADLGARVLAFAPFGTHTDGAGGLGPEAAAEAVVEGALLRLHRTPTMRSRDAGAAGGAGAGEGDAPLLLVHHDSELRGALESGARAGRAVALGTALARDLVALPPNVATPTRMAEVARLLAEEGGLSVEVGDRAWAEARGMGAYLAVAKGTPEPPAFVVLERNAGRDDLPVVCLVGKGVTFDSGGLSLKSGAGMVPMKSDMGGAAAVLGAMRTVALLDLPLRVVALCPCVQNMPDGDAYRPSDVVMASNGKTIEIISTDAEGRLALADALVFAQGFEPVATIDVATLTGSCVTALGRGVAAGLFADDDALAARVAAASDATGERTWRLPLWPEYRKAIDSDVADMKNSGGAKGGVGTSAALLAEFAPRGWAHLDIAGMALASSGEGYVPAGATGFGARLLAEVLRRW